MPYALINQDGSFNTITVQESFVWRGLTFTSVSLMTPDERRKFGIYDYAQKFQETPEGMKHLGFHKEIDPAEGIVYEVPDFVEKSTEELKEELKQKTLAGITSLEASVTPRRMREAMLTEEGKLWLADIDTQIATLRKSLQE